MNTLLDIVADPGREPQFPQRRMRRSAETPLRLLAALAFFVWPAVLHAQPFRYGEFFRGTNAAASSGSHNFTPTEVWVGAVSSSSTTVYTLTNSVPGGSTIVFMAYNSGGSETPGSVTDSTGANTYTLRAGPQSGSPMSIFVSPNITALAVGATITITWNSPAYTYRYGLIGYATGVSTLDVAVAVGSYGTSIGSSANGSVSANSVQFGVVQLPGGTTYGSGNWTGGKSYTGGDSTTLTSFYNIQSTGATQNPGGSWTGNQSWYVVWLSLK